MKKRPVSFRAERWLIFLCWHSLSFLCLAQIPKHSSVLIGLWFLMDFFLGIASLIVLDMREAIVRLEDERKELEKRDIDKLSKAASKIWEEYKKAEKI